ncbi:MAG: hypothetical protein FWD16_03400 [Clostridia bacterium]|nr:hypothetical protein [Clostridia bacterium]
MKKHIILSTVSALLLAALLLGACGSAVFAVRLLTDAELLQIRYKPGDIDDSDKIDISDILLARDIIFGDEKDFKPEEVLAAKLAGTEYEVAKVNIDVILRLRDHIFGTIDLWEKLELPKPTGTAPEGTATPSATRTTRPTPTPEPPLTPFPADRFVPLGPGAGGCFYKPAVNPIDPNIVMVGTDMSGNFASSNGGASWLQHTFCASAWSYGFDPNDKNCIYASVRTGLYQSLDAGQSFKRVFPNEDDSYVTSGGEYGATVRMKNGSNIAARYCTVVDPEDKNIVYCLTAESNGTIYKSTDRGVTWNKLTLSVALPANLVRTEDYMRVNTHLAKMYIDPASPKNAREIYLFCSRGCWKITDNGAATLTATAKYEYDRLESIPKDAAADKWPASSVTWAYDTETKTTHFWRIRSNADSSNNAANEAKKPLDPTNRSWPILEKSTDMMATWKPVVVPPDPGMNANLFTNFNFVDAADQKVLYLSMLNSTRAGATAGYGKAQELYGMMKSEDGGDTWAWSLKLTHTFPQNFVNKGWLELKNVGPSWSGDGFGLSCGKGEEGKDVCYVANMGSVYSTTDGGDTWGQVASNMRNDGTSATRGLDVLGPHDIVFDPFNANIALACYTDIGGHISHNGGQTWRAAAGASDWGNTLYSADFDPDNEGIVYGAWSAYHDLPGLLRTEYGNIAIAKGGICISTNSGAFWAKSSTGMDTNFACTGVMIDLESNPESRIVYACGYGGTANGGKGVIYRSEDSGKNWTLFMDGIETEDIRPWQFSRSEKDGRIYCNFMYRTGTWQVLEPGAVYYIDQGDTEWTKCDWLPTADTIVFNQVTVDPKDPLTIFVTGRTRPGGAAVNFESGATGLRGGGIFKTTDGGITWEDVYDPRKSAKAVVINPNDSKIVYMASADNLTFVSYEGGAKNSWIPTKFNNHANVVNIGVNPAKPNFMYVCAYGGGIFHGPIPPKIS